VPKVPHLGLCYLAGLERLDTRSNSTSSIRTSHGNRMIFVSNLERFPRVLREEIDHPRLLGAVSPEARWLNTSGEILHGLEEKSGKYGDLGGPFVIAVQTFSLHCDVADAVDALFGREGVSIEWAQADSEPQQSTFRHSDGFWCGPSGIRNKHVSAVLLTSGLNPWNMHISRPMLFHNPWATYPLEFSGPFTVYSVGVAGEMIRRKASVSMSAALGLPDLWPGKENFAFD